MKLTDAQKRILIACAQGRVAWHAYRDNRPAHAVVEHGRERAPCTLVVKRLQRAGLVTIPGRLERSRDVQPTYAGHCAVTSIMREASL